MAGEIISGLLGAGASLIGGYVNNQYARERADEQWQRTLYMQDRMNAYNAPSAQMSRLKDAGLNPNLVYANGGAVIQSAGGQPPAPPQTHPIDTQGVLQMVQTIVGAMLEKDRIEANKEMQTQSIKSQEQMHEASIESQQAMQDKSIKSQEDMQVKDLRTKSTIAIQDRLENQRQFDESLKQRISEFNDTHELNALLVKSQVAKNYSDIDIDNQRVVIERAQYRMAARLSALKEQQGYDDFQAQRISNFFSRPMKYSVDVVFDFFNDELGIPIDYQDARDFSESHNNMVGAIEVENWSRNSYPGAVWNVISGPVKSILGAVK